MCSSGSPAAPTTRSSEQTCRNEVPVTLLKDSTSRNSRLLFPPSLVPRPCGLGTRLFHTHAFVYLISCQYWQILAIQYRLLEYQLLESLLVQYQCPSNKSVVRRPWVPNHSWIPLRDLPLQICLFPVSVKLFTCTVSVRQIFWCWAACTYTLARCYISSTLHLTECNLNTG